MTAAALDFDPYLLPLPAPGTPVVPAHLATPLHAHLNGRYADPVWHLAPLTGNPSAKKSRINWEQWPATFKEEMRLAAWNLINGQLRPTFIHGRSGMRSRPSLSLINASVHKWRHLARWLEQRGIGSLAGCDAGLLHEYSQYLRDSGGSRSHIEKHLMALIRLWALDQLSARPSGIARPPWEDRGVDDYLPAATTTGSGENATEPLAEQTMGPLLIWAMRLVDDLSGDILAGWAERQRLINAACASTAAPAGRARLEEYLRPLIASQAPVPAAMQHGQPALARCYIGGITGASPGQVNRIALREGLAAAAARQPGPCPLDIPVTGRIAGKPWRAALDFNEVRVLLRHLGTAAFIVCAYLTGMRAGEILALRAGCCPDPVPGPDGQPGRHLIRGLEFKTATDEDGNHDSFGAEREVPWVAITPVVNAIRVLERMVPDGHLLFGHDAHDLRTPRPDTGSLKLNTLWQRVGEFADWANGEAARHGLPGEAIPADPHGPIGLARFRRSLAWHIARRPNGLVALAIQYGHMRTAFIWTTEGYAGRSRDGIHDLIDLETARATADTLAAIHDDLGNGGGISGPAARRVIRAAASAPRFAGVAGR